MGDMYILLLCLLCLSFVCFFVDFVCLSERTLCSECSSLWVPLGEERGLCTAGDKGDKEADCSASSAESHIRETWGMLAETYVMDIVWSAGHCGKINNNEMIGIFVSP